VLGLKEGLLEGEEEGFLVGLVLGLFVGSGVGLMEGLFEGLTVGSGVTRIQHSQSSGVPPPLLQSLSLLLNPNGALIVGTCVSQTDCVALKGAQNAGQPNWSSQKSKLHRAPSRKQHTHSPAGAPPIEQPKSVVMAP